MDQHAHIQIRGAYLMVKPTTHRSYKRLLSVIHEKKWEYYTYNPMIDNSTKYCLKGLPVQTDAKDIQEAFSDKDIRIINVRQMTKSSLENETISHKPIPVWVLTTDNSEKTRDKLMNLTGILYFKIKIEDLRQRQTTIQCLRCQAFGHKAPFCRLTRKCRLCAEQHDTRNCPNRNLPPKCAGCGGDHPASFADCPTKLKYKKQLTKLTKQTPSPSTDKADFPTLAPNPQPTPPPPSSWKPNTAQTHPENPPSSSLADLISLLSNPALSNVLTLLSNFLRKLANSPSALTSVTNLLTSASNLLH